MTQKNFRTIVNGEELIFQETDLFKAINNKFEQVTFYSDELKQDIYDVFLNLVRQDIDPTGVSLFELAHCLGAMEWANKILKNEPYFTSGNNLSDAYNIAAALHDSSRVFLETPIHGDFKLENVLLAHYDMRGHDKVSADLVRTYLSGKIKDELVEQTSSLIANHGSKKTREREIYDAIRIADAAQTILPGEYGRVPLWELCALQAEFLEEGTISIESQRKALEKINPVRMQPEYRKMSDTELVDRAIAEVVDYKKLDLPGLYPDLIDIRIIEENEKTTDKMAFERGQNDIIYRISTNAAYNLIEKSIKSSAD